MYSTTELCEVSSKANGAKIVFSSNDFFGIAENLLEETEPDTENAEIVTYRSSCRDAWITRRRRLQNNDLCDFVIIQLAARAEIPIICIDTTNLFSNVALKFSVQAANLPITDDGISDSILDIYQNRFDRIGKDATNDEWSNINRIHSEAWPIIISWQSLNPGYPSMNKKVFMIPCTGQVYTHVRLNIFPDGGISRLRVYGKVCKPLPKSCIDLVSQIYGGNCITYSSCYNNTHPNNLIKPIQDGWETQRSLVRSTFPISNSSLDFNQIIGEEWAIFQLGYSGKITSIEIDTTRSKGDSPYIVKVEGLEEGNIINNKLDINNKSWQNIIPYTLVNEGTKQQITVENQNMKMSYVKLVFKPDGCITKFRVLGQID